MYNSSKCDFSCTFQVKDKALFYTSPERQSKKIYFCVSPYVRKCHFLMCLVDLVNVQCDDGKLNIIVARNST